MGGKDITASRGSSNFFQTRYRGILGVNGATAVYDLVMDGVGVGI